MIYLSALHEPIYFVLEYSSLRTFKLSNIYISFDLWTEYNIIMVCYNSKNTFNVLRFDLKSSYYYLPLYVIILYYEHTGTQYTDYNLCYRLEIYT